MESIRFNKEAVRRALGLRREILFAVVLTLATVLYVIIGTIHKPTADGKTIPPVAGPVALEPAALEIAR